jgi:hypothetical protein
MAMPRWALLTALAVLAAGCRPPSSAAAIDAARQAVGQCERRQQWAQAVTWRLELIRLGVAQEQAGAEADGAATQLAGRSGLREDTAGLTADQARWSAAALLAIVETRPASARSRRAAWQACGAADAMAVCSLALQAWRAEHGHYPASLDELVASGCLPHLPTDPYSGGPLRYVPVGERYELSSAAGGAP